MNYQHQLDKVRHSVHHFFKNKNLSQLCYHNLVHTESVVANAARIGGHYELNERDLFIVQTAAWYHDTGYVNGETAGHEQRGAELAAAFLRSEGIGEEIVEKVQQCILATIWPQNPSDLLEQIVCDADVYHLGTPEFSDWNKLVRKEAEQKVGHKIDKAKWRESTIRLFESHRFQTDYCRDLLNKQKEKNLAKLKEKQTEAADTSEPPAALKAAEVQPNVAEDKKTKSDRPDKGIETMFRISSNNHQRLSDMADNKAHIMITTTSIIISVLLSVLIRRLEDNTYLIFPTTLLLAVCLVTMVFSILSTRPTIPHGTFSQEDIDNKSVNLLFFGNFYRMSYQDYAGGMQRLMNDREFLYGSLTKDVYSQGVVLGKKYRLLRIGYNVFMFGIIVSVISFVVASLLFEH
ncbi:Pycsar system effector family protein [Dyadobacter sp. Leaf189]|uniref:Pycsar system effector family protein n=1 Tax=Dyadobacter sp. Leaf189 TaxID=1736295 RepID=UPI0006FC2E00|nr:Pycsar system effector family protein [Dyadobacter sp. Leaf189]KQS34034.1 phosphohydrolase [Dyadobacter sp. Leaf189]